VVRAENDWGIKKIDSESKIEIDLDESKKLVKELKKSGLSLLNITAGTPYLNPQTPIKGSGKII